MRRAAVGLIVLGLIACGGDEIVRDAQKKIGSTTPQGDLIVISLDEFNEIQNGMTLEQVEAIIGGPGKLSSESQIGEYHNQNYQWAGEGLGDNAIIGLQNGAVFSKTQVGLG